MRPYLKRLIDSIKSILEGMAVTLSWMFRRPSTIQWPDKIEQPLETTLPSRFRGILEVETRLCTACRQCEKSCPIDCIRIAVERDPETNQRTIDSFAINAAKCMYCGLCAEACPTGAIRHTSQFAAATSSIQELVLQFVEPGHPLTPAKPKAEVANVRARGSIVVSLLDHRDWSRCGVSPAASAPAERARAIDSTGTPDS